ncbi:MAG TPA: hypothetical protein VK477_01375 [Acidobacteriota bacterium]|nr:hypothetical protein [Acidobacteriota bacterium]
MKLTDHESDTTAATRLGTPSPRTAAAPAYRESWLDKLARHLGATPVDHVIIPPTTVRRAPLCCAGAEPSL